MSDAFDVIKTISTVLTAIIAIVGVVVAVVKWFLAQEKQTKDIADLRTLHQKDMEETKKREATEMQAVRDELCVLSYAMLAALDGLKQLHCNGEVTKAHDKLETHINQQAHRKK